MGWNTNSRDQCLSGNVMNIVIVTWKCLKEMSYKLQNEQEQTTVANPSTLWTREEKEKRLNILQLFPH